MRIYSCKLCGQPIMYVDNKGNGFSLYRSYMQLSADPRFDYCGQLCYEEACKREPEKFKIKETIHKISMFIAIPITILTMVAVFLFGYSFDDLSTSTVQRIIVGVILAALCGYIVSMISSIIGVIIGVIIVYIVGIIAIIWGIIRRIIAIIWGIIRRIIVAFKKTE